MNSALYSCTLQHQRILPKKHSFSYRLFYFYLDLDELEELSDKNFLISYKRSNLYSFLDSDHMQFGYDSIKENVHAYLREQKIDYSVGKIYLFTLLRSFGYQFNPVSFYYVYDKDSVLRHVIAEVANTFNEQKLFLLNFEEGIQKTFTNKQKKHFYISPFSDLDTEFSFRLNEPLDEMDLTIRQKTEKNIDFFAQIRGKKTRISHKSLLLYTMRFPFITASILFSIHWQALKLFIKRIPVRSKSANPHLQKNVRSYLIKKKSMKLGISK